MSPSVPALLCPLREPRGCAGGWGGDRRAGEGGVPCLCVTDIGVTSATEAGVCVASIGKSCSQGFFPQSRRGTQTRRGAPVSPWQGARRPSGNLTPGHLCWGSLGCPGSHQTETPGSSSLLSKSTSATSHCGARVPGEPSACMVAFPARVTDASVHGISLQAAVRAGARSSAHGASVNVCRSCTQAGQGGLAWWLCFGEFTHFCATCEWTEGRRRVGGQGGRAFWQGDPACPQTLQRPPCLLPLVGGVQLGQQVRALASAVPRPRGPRPPRPALSPLHTVLTFSRHTEQTCALCLAFSSYPDGLSRRLSSEPHAPWGTGKAGPPSSPPLRVRPWSVATQLLAPVALPEPLSSALGSRWASGAVSRAAGQRAWPVSGS